MAIEPILLERRGRVGLVTLNRPEKLNALNSQLVGRLEQALQQLEADDDIGAIVITGAGERAFSAGGDMAEQVAALEAPSAAPRVGASAVVRACLKPTLAAIRGYCFGGGALLAIECDIRIGGEDARLKFHGASYGRAPGGASLPRIVGSAKAKELLFTGDEISAAEALRIGLLNQVVRAEAVVETSVAMGARIAANSPVAVKALKEIIDTALPIGSALEQEEYLNRDMGRSDDSASRFRSAAARVLGLAPPPSEDDEHA
ncbi:MAG: enoyl-CoA hydratase/isomerase family protein [Chloroflexota bacterium]|nr:enoyl-CoA hydratase/isomerase family protein [Chloroflexota bacterium]